MSSGSVVSLTGEKNVWEVVIRPPETAAVITLTIAADAVDQGNVETTKDIRISTSFPDADAEVPTSLFDVNFSTVAGIAVSPTRIFVASNRIHKYLHDGTEQVTEEITTSRNITTYFNGSLLVLGSTATFAQRLDAEDGSVIQTFPFSRTTPIIPTRLGFFGKKGQHHTFNTPLRKHRYC